MRRRPGAVPRWLRIRSLRVREGSIRAGVRECYVPAGDSARESDAVLDLWPTRSSVALHRGALQLRDLAREPRGVVDPAELEVEVVARRRVEVDEADAEHALQEALVG